MDHSELHEDPVIQFHRWFEQAAAVNPMPEAMCIATVDEGGLPDARMVLLKGADQDGFRFFTNRTSLKGSQLADNPRAQLLFFWRELGRQILIHGNVDQLGDEESDAYFESRARESRIGAWASEQGSVIESREELLGRVEEAERKFEGEDVPRPPHWGGYRVSPQAIEFWQAGEFRLHDRFVFVKSAAGWTAERLSP